MSIIKYIKGQRWRAHETDIGQWMLSDQSGFPVLKIEGRGDHSKELAEALGRFPEMLDILERLAVFHESKTANALIVRFAKEANNLLKQLNHE